jgi:cold shock CspA family protein
MSGERKQGTITKVVHVTLRPEKPARDHGVAGFQEGYGLLRGHDGQQLFFVDSAVEDGSFSELRVGETVYYSVEPGPLVRAAAVRPVRRTSEAGERVS